MNGPQHYAEAERLMGLAENTDWTVESAPYRNPALAASQVHATLALVAATIEAATTMTDHSTPEGYSASRSCPASVDQWTEVMS